MKYLGYIVDHNDLHVDPENFEPVLEFSVSTRMTEVRCIVGTFSWYPGIVLDFLPSCLQEHHCLGRKINLHRG